VDGDQDMPTAIVRWVEEDIAPDRIIASKARDKKVTMTRRAVNVDHPSSLIFFSNASQKAGL